jgi:hypothetical protein
MRIQDIIFTRQDKVITGAEEIGWAMLWLCCALPCCVTIILPGASMWRLVVGFLMILCGCFALPYVPRAIKNYIIQPHTGSGACCHGPKCVRLGIIGALFVAVGGGIEMIRLMLPQIAHAMQYEMSHPSVTSHSADMLADKTLLFMIVVSGVFLYVKESGLIRENPWKWPLLVLIVLGPVGIDLMFPHYFMLIMLFVGLVWLVSGGVTLYLFLQNPNRRSGKLCGVQSK